MWNDRIEQVKENRLKQSLGGGEARVLKQHENGKLTARERVSLLLDPGSFTETGAGVMPDTGAVSFGEPKMIPGDGVITGFGTVEGRTVCVAADDFTVAGGTLGTAHARKIVRLQDLAFSMKVPIVFLNDSGGARIEEGINSLSGYGEMFTRHVRASGVIPQICAVLGPCSGGACYSPALCDFLFIVDGISKMFITGPAVVETVLGKRPTFEELGGADVHSRISGVSHALFEDEISCLRGIRDLLRYLPSSCEEQPPAEDPPAVEKVYSSEPEKASVRELFQQIVPDNERKAYDMHLVIEQLMDSGNPLFEIQKEFAPNAIVGFGRLGGKVTGIVANQPMAAGGALDCDASDKIARFIRFCDCFHIPLLTLVDVPAFLPGIEQEQKGIIRHGAKILYAYAEATVARVTVLIRKAYGGAYIAMNSKTLGADLVYAWPIAQIAVMGARGAVEILYKKQLKDSDHAEEDMAAYERSYEERFLNSDIAEQRGFVDEVILPEETREKLLKAFSSLEARNRVTDGLGRKHGNIPL